MKKCVLLFLSLFAVIPASGQESGYRICGNNGYYQQKLQTNTGMLRNLNEGYAIEARVLTNFKPDAFVIVFGINDEGSNAAANNEKAGMMEGLTSARPEKSLILHSFKDHSGEGKNDEPYQ